MDENPFNDYYETDSYYEEENTSDIESKLYANIHYTSVENEAPDETPDTSKIRSMNTTNINDMEVSNNNEQNVSTNKCTKNRENAGHDPYQSVQGDKEVIINEVNKTVCVSPMQKTCNNNKDPYIFDANVEDQSTILPIRTKRQRKRMSKRKSHEDIRQRLLNFVFKTPDPLPISPPVSNKRKNQSVNHCNPQDSSVSNVTTSNKKSTKSPKKKHDTENVFMKYQKSKESLNKVYTEKHKEIEGMDTKYDVLEKQEKEKLQNNEHSSNAKNVDSDSDSDQSILEIPIPPKPAPPIINLNDSDEDIECINDDDVIAKQPLTIDNCNTVDFKNQVKRALSKSQSELITMNDSETLDNANFTEDIVLNCTEIEKGASSINEIREMRKDAQKKRKSNATKEKDSGVLQESVNVDNSKNKSKRIADVNNVLPSNKDKRHFDRGTIKGINNFFNKQIEDNESQIYLQNINEDYTEDVFPADSFIRSQNELNASKKRQLEHQHQVNDKLKRKKNIGESSQSNTSTSNTQSKIQENTDKSPNTSFFHPMSEKLKAFYTNSRGQENYDLKEVQSKMSKDPQLWAILDEDLRPNSQKQRFWNIRCTHCQQHGHQRQSCPEPRRTPKCHMCGVEGHTEVRCPQKMCLTCGKRQGTFRKTCETCRTFYCTMCNAVGHKYTECPDLWRRYHQTTTTNDVSIPGNKGAMKPADLLFCCNCTKRGHDSSMCKDYRWSQHFPTPPFVSNYKDGPTYVEEPTKNMDILSDVDVVQFHDSANSGITVPSSNDLLPFPKELLKKIRSRKKAFPQNIPQLALGNELNVAYIIFQCGNFYTLENNGTEISYTITARKGFNTYNIMECRVVPNFLEKLLELFRFEVKIYKEIGAVNEIILRVRTFANLIDDLCRFILYWLSLEDDEKDYVIFLNLPIHRKAMLNILQSKIKKVGKETGNATGMYNAILTLKLGLQTTRNQAKYNKMLSHLQETQYKLLLILNDHPNLQKIPEEMRKLIKVLERSSSEHVPIQQYLQILTVYNFLFVPHTPPKSFITKYGKKSNPAVSVPKSTQKHNPNNTVPSIQSPVQHDSTIPVIVTNRASKNKNSQTCEPAEFNSAQEDFSNMSNVTKEVYMPLPQTTVSSHHIRFEGNVNHNNISENSKMSECNDLSETATDRSEGFSDDFILNRNIVKYDTVSTLHDFLPIDTASEKYTNITVNVSNKDKVHATESLKSNSTSDKDQNISKCTNITFNVSNKNRTDTITNSKSNMDSSKNDNCQNTNKYTNITVSVSNKDQAHTTTSFQSNVNNSKSKHKNGNKYTNITVSVSGKNQTHTAVSTVSNLNNPTNYNLQSSNTDNSESNQPADDDDVVCIEINKKVPNHVEKQQKKQTQNTNKNNIQFKFPKLPEKKAKKKNNGQKDLPKDIKAATIVRFKLIQLNNVINKNLSICSSDNPREWKKLSKLIMGAVSQFHIPHLDKAARGLKNKIDKNILSTQEVYMFQRLVNMELQHQQQIQKLYKKFHQSPNQSNKGKADMPA